MKKLITVLLVLVMALSLAACGSSQTADTSEELQETETSKEEQTAETADLQNETEKEPVDLEIVDSSYI